MLRQCYTIAEEYLTPYQTAVIAKSRVNIF